MDTLMRYWPIVVSVVGLAAFAYRWGGKVDGKVDKATCDEHRRQLDKMLADKASSAALESHARDVRETHDEVIKVGTKIENIEKLVSETREDIKSWTRRDS